MSDGTWLTAAILFGACVGSFLNVVIWRLPRGTFFSLGQRSVCPACGKRIAWYDNLPIVGWLLLRGRARCCGTAISIRYPLVEAITASLFAALWLWPPSGRALDAHALDGLALLAFAFHAFFVATLVANTFIDIDFRILPDELTYSALVAGLIGAFVVPGLAGSFDAPGVAPALRSFLFSAVGAAVGFGVTAAIRTGGSMLFRKEAMGFGDVKLMAAIGAYVGPTDVLLVFLIASVVGALYGIGSVWMTRDPRIAFGPFLVVGALVTLFAGDALRTFLFDTWPRWQTQHASPWLLVVVGLVCLVLLFVLVRKGRRL
jgi:leader peptidase (prepilin peptidase)/N-methyltransferase